jgi:hypothetical protein
MSMPDPPHCAAADLLAQALNRFDSGRGERPGGRARPHQYPQASDAAMPDLLLE